MLEVSAVSVLNNVKTKLATYQLFFHYGWLQSFLNNNDNIISSEIGFDKKITLEKNHLFITIISIGIHKCLALVVVLLEKHFILILDE